MNQLILSTRTTHKKKNKEIVQDTKYVHTANKMFQFGEITFEIYANIVIGYKQKYQLKFEEVWDNLDLMTDYIKKFAEQDSNHILSIGDGKQLGKLEQQTMKLAKHYRDRDYSRNDNKEFYENLINYGHQFKIGLVDSLNNLERYNRHKRLLKYTNDN